MDDRGHIVVIDRAKDVGQLSDGSAYAPQFIENKLKFSPYISEAVSFGDKRPFICAMVAIDLNTVGNWAERQALAYTNYMGPEPEAGDLRGWSVRRSSASTAACRKPGRVKRFLLLGKDLDADRCGDHPHPQAAPVLHRRQIRRCDRGVLFRRDLRRAAHRRHLRGRPGSLHRQPHANPRRGLRGAHPLWRTSTGAFSWNCWSPAS